MEKVESELKHDDEEDEAGDNDYDDKYIYLLYVSHHVYTEMR